MTPYFEGHHRGSTFGHEVLVGGGWRAPYLFFDTIVEVHSIRYEHVVVLTLSRIIKSVVTGQVSVTP